MIITYNVPYATYKAVRKAFRKTEITIAYDCTEWNTYAEGSLPKRLYKKHDEKLIRERLPKKCRDIIVISKMMEEQYKGCNLLRLPPLVDIDDPIWHQDREEHRGIFEFCFAGRVSKNKESLDKILDAFHGLEDENLRLRIIGYDKREYLSVYPYHDRLLSEEDRIVFMGYISHEETVRYVLSCDCYIFVREVHRRNMAVFPSKFSEAITCGAPIITTDVSDIMDYMKDGSRGIVINGIDQDKIQIAMSEIIGGQFSKKSLSENPFDYRNFIRETEEWISRKQ